MIPTDPQDMIEAASRIERHGHKHGWDKPPILGVVYHEEGRFKIVPIPIDLRKLHSSPLVALLGLVDNMRRNRESREIVNRQFPDTVPGMCAGVWLKYETRSIRTPAEEQRVVLLIDFGARVYSVDRIRGEGPRERVGEDAVDGLLLGALAKVALEYCYGIPADAYDEAAIRELATPAIRDECHLCGHPNGPHALVQLFVDPMDGGIRLCPECACWSAWSAQGRPKPTNVPGPDEVAELRLGVFGEPK